MKAQGKKSSILLIVIIIALYSLSISSCQVEKKVQLSSGKYLSVYYFTSGQGKPVIGSICNKDGYIIPILSSEQIAEEKTNFSGFIVYNKDDSNLYYWDGIRFVSMQSSKKVRSIPHKRK